MTGEMSNERAKEELLFIELVAAALVRAAELAAVVLIFLLVCPPLLILLVVVGVPLVALFAIAAVLSLPYEVLRHLRGRRTHHTSIVLRRLQRLRHA
jgi:hypothetical protein